MFGSELHIPPILPLSSCSHSISYFLSSFPLIYNHIPYTPTLPQTTKQQPQSTLEHIYTIMSSSTKSFLGCKQKTDDNGRAEESGWTSYLQDFSLNSSSDNYGGSAYSHRRDYSRFGGPSLHSDASSPTAWKERRGGAHDHDGRDGGNNIPCSSMGGFQRLKNLKKSKKKISDPDLEDTASSPVNSPKVTPHIFSSLSFLLKLE